MRRAIILLMLAGIACHKQEAPAPVAKKPAKKPAVTSKEAASQRTEVGDVMPEYASNNLDGTSFKLASEKGNVVLLNVWATWCGPCRMEIPELQKLHDKYRDRGFKVVGVSVDDTGVDDVKQFVQQQKVNYPIVVDAEGKLANLLQTTVLPTSVVVDRSGKIVWRQVGALMPNEVVPLQSVIEKALNRSSS